MDINLLVKLTSRAWSLTILALMDNGVPGRQATLMAHAGASRTAFAASMRHLTELSMIERNPGHGHPLRPEFRLTDQGRVVAARATKITELAADDALLRRTWTIPILATTTRPRYFGEIKQSLGNITDRSLSKSLKSLEGHQWLDREVMTNIHPPRPVYHAKNIGKRIANAVSGGV